MAGTLAKLIFLLFLSGTVRAQTPRSQDTIPFYLSQLSFAQGRLDEALDRCERYYEQASQNKNADEIFLSLTGIFDIYRQKGDFDKAFFYARKLYEVAEKTGNQPWLSVSLWCLAQLYAVEGNYIDALTYYRRAAPLPHKQIKGIDPKTRFDVELAEVFSQLDQFDSAWFYYNRFKAAGDTDRAIYLVSTGECYFLQGKFQQALDNFQSGRKSYQERQDANGLMRVLPDIARTFLTLGDAKTALQFGRTGLNIALDSKANQYVRDGYLILSQAYARLGLMDSANYYFSRHSLVKEAVLNDIVKAKLAAWRFEEKIALINEENQVQAIQLQKEALLKKILLGSLAGLAVLAFTFFRIAKLKRKNEERMRQLAENALQIQRLESDARQAGLLQQTSDLELKALRARMNPHFIFNCLNSINRFIIKNDTEKAADYLTKFAKLMRMVLESSAKPLIPLTEELNILKLYITLENLRFERPFTFVINSQGIDTSAVMMPTLLIQPFVENAIWHGLSAREDLEGKIAIDLRLDKDLLYCEISDNGIGRKRAAMMKTDRTEAQNPLGIGLTIQRLERMDPSHTWLAGVAIDDITNDTGDTLGTRVMLKIPVKFI